MQQTHDVFRRNIWVSPYSEDCVSDVVNTVGWVKVLFGSDYPHPRGTSWDCRSPTPPGGEQAACDV